MVYQIMSHQNDEEVLRYNKRPVTLPTRKMAECYDYPQYDLGEFYEQLANCGNHIETRWAKKAGKLWLGVYTRTFWVRRKNE